MSPLLGSAGALLAALGGFIALSLAMDRHYEDSFGRGRSPGRLRGWLQLGGAAGLLLSMLVCFGLRGAAQGAVLWCGLLTASAIAVSLMLSYAPRHAVRILYLASGVAAIVLLLDMV